MAVRPRPLAIALALALAYAAPRSAAAAAAAAASQISSRAEDLRINKEIRDRLKHTQNQFEKPLVQNQYVSISKKNLEGGR